jgi:acetyltransferase-like isoleucine patch superfamily enzyme
VSAYRKLVRYWMIVKILFIRDPYRRADYLKKRHYFHAQGDNCYFQISNFNTEPHLISFGNNVHVARGVEFFTHDVISYMLNYMYNDVHFVGRVGRVDIGDNVFIGGSTTILYNVKIGNNVIIAENSLIIKDIPDGVVVGGQPARVIGPFDEYVYKMKEYS